MSAFAYVDVDGMRRWVPVEWCDVCGMSMPADHETFRHADNPHLYPVQAGAPGRCVAEGAHESANDCQESSAMSNLIEAPHADTRQGRQMTAAIAIAKMCEHQLPEIASWHIDVTEGAPIEGLLTHSGDLAAKLADWRLYLKADEPRVVAYTTSDSGCVEVVGSYHGPAGDVRVRIWHGVTAAKLAELNAERRAS